MTTLTLSTNGCGVVVLMGLGLNIDNSLQTSKATLQEPTGNGHDVKVVDPGDVIIVPLLRKDSFKRQKQRTKSEPSTVFTSRLQIC
jgi:hypothetical protein